MPIAVPAAPLETVLIAEPPANGAERVERHEDTTLPKADLPSLLDLQWYEARDLDSYPRPLAAIEPSYPSARQADGRPGHVTLMLAIDETGVVRDAVLVSAEPEGVFETAALAAARAALFAPARKNGSAVRSKIVVKLRFAAEHPIQ
jgi:protein TonB